MNPCAMAVFPLGRLLRNSAIPPIRHVTRYSVSTGERSPPHHISIMTTISCLFFWVFIPVVIVCVILGRLTETRRQQIRRMRREGLSQQAIATALGISRYRVRQALA